MTHSVKSKRILALDLGSKTGWAVGTSAGVEASGTLTLTRAGELRWPALWHGIEGIADGVDAIDLVAFEEVHRHAGTRAAHVYGGLKAVLEWWAHAYWAPVEGFGVGTIKKHATGKGTASKADMIFAAEARGWDPVDDNEADALWILDLALQPRRD